MRARIAISLALGLVLASALIVPAQAITNGVPEADPGGKDHPWVGALLRLPREGEDVEAQATCTGTMISNRVMVTAAHCPFIDGGEVSVTFANQVDFEQSPADQGIEGTFVRNQFYKTATEYDIAAVVFPASSSPGVGHASLADLGFLDVKKQQGLLTSATQFTMVGYGGTYPTNEPGGGGPVIAHPATKMWTVGTFKSMNQNQLQTSQKAKKGEGGTCSGDSGGPTFWGAGTGETDTLVSTAITGDTTCKSLNVTARMDSKIAHDFLDPILADPDHYL